MNTKYLKICLISICVLASSLPVVVYVFGFMKEPPKYEMVIKNQDGSYSRHPEEERANKLKKMGILSLLVSSIIVPIFIYSSLKHIKEKNKQNKRMETN